MSHCPIESLSTASRWWFITADRLRYDKAAHSLRALHAWMQLFDGLVGCFFFVQGEGTIPQHLLRKYIMYARNNVRPQLHNIDQDKVSPRYNGLQKTYVCARCHKRCDLHWSRMLTLKRDSFYALFLNSLAMVRWRSVLIQDNTA